MTNTNPQFNVNSNSTKRLFTCKLFDTKNDAFQFIAGRKMVNNMIVGEELDTVNVLFLQLGEATYTNDGVVHYRGKNSFEENGQVIVSLSYGDSNPVLKNFAKPTLIFVKRKDKKGKQYYTFQGLFRTEAIGTDSELEGVTLNRTTFRRLQSDVYV